MADKKESGGTEGRSCDGPQTLSVSNSNYGVRKQFKSRALPYTSKDKRGHDRTRALQPRNGEATTRGYDQRPSNQRQGHKAGTGDKKNKKFPLLSDPLSSYEDGGYKGGKNKPSLNYLLNFTIASTERRSGFVGVSGGRRRTRTGHSYNKEQFLQANCQFVVSATGEYRVHSSDPDLLVDWEHIEQVRLFCHEIPSCPICLYPPRAAKISRCGHVYCWSCLLHYLSLADKKWRKCPICYESIYQKDLKSVTALSSHQYTVGDCLTLRLMARRKGTTLVLPREEWSKKRDSLLTIQDTAVNQWAKLLSATPTQVLALITGPEREELHTQLASIDKDSVSEQRFVESALQELEEREATLRKSQGLCDTKMVEAVQRTPNPSPPAMTSFSDQYVESCFEDPFPNHRSQEQEMVSPTEGGEGSKVTVDPPIVSTLNPVLDDSSLTSVDSDTTTHDSPLSSSSSDGSSQPLDNDLVYFYQACDGQHLYLQSINAKCLIKEYGGLELCPDEIQATIVQMDDLSISKEVRSHYRYLSHLPLTCELSLVEVDLKPPLLSKATLASFADDLAVRRQQRLKKKKEERRRERKMEAKEVQTMEAMFVVPTSAHEMTPEVFHDFLSLASTPSQSQQLPPSEDSPSSGPSFAQALQGSKPPSTWPVQSPPRAWSSVSNGTTCVVDMRTVSDDEGAAPMFKDAFNNALASASVSVRAAQNVSGGKPGSKTAKKGRKKMVLFSTGSTRGTS